MTENDIDAFFLMLDETFDALGKTPAAKIISASAKAIFFRACAEHSIDDVRAALDHHCRTKVFTPVPSDINTFCTALRGGSHQWLGGNEAWGRLTFPSKPKTFKRTNEYGDMVTRTDHREAEAGPCLMNQQMAQALAVAQPQIDAGDLIPARVTLVDGADAIPVTA